MIDLKGAVPGAVCMASTKRGDCKCGHDKSRGRS